MLLNTRFIQLIENPVAALWVCNCNELLEPELARLLGCQVGSDKEFLTFYLPTLLGKKVIQNFSSTDKLSFLLAHVQTNESYQLKGTYCWHRPCTVEEVSFQDAYMRGFSTAIEAQGFSRSVVYKAYFNQPSVAVHMQVQEVYEQTPKIGTGKKVIPT
jgi:hypothetical protein